MACMQVDYTMGGQRIISFKNQNWKLGGTLSVKELAEAGLYYSGQKDIVTCPWCHVKLSNWKPDENPMVKHARNSPRCQFVIQVQLSKNSKLVDEINLQMLGQGLEQDLNWQRYVNKSGSIKIVSEMGYDYDIILKAVEKISADGYSDMNTDQLLDEIFKLEEQQEKDVDKPDTDVDLASERRRQMPFNDVVQKSKTLLKPNIKNDIVKEAIIGVLSFGERVTVPKVLSTIAIISYHQLVLLPIQKDMQQQEKDMQQQEKQLNDLVKENTNLKEDLDKLQKSYRCKVCLENPIEYIFLPCRHLVCCDVCYIHVHHCPVCRGEIMGRYKTFMG